MYNVYNILIIVKVNGKKLNDTVFYSTMIDHDHPGVPMGPFRATWKEFVMS